MSTLSHWLLTTAEVISALLIVMITLGLIAVLVIYVIDRTQTQHAIRRNFPVIGRFRYLFEHLGEFFRQYFFAMDREEMPFNRSQRAWAYRAAKNVDTTGAFGSTRDLRPEGTVFFVNCPFPTLDEDSVSPQALTIGPYCRDPYSHASFFNISGMSFGAISKPAVQALSRGARLADVWLNTGEGGLSPYHLEGGCDIVFQVGTAKYGVRDSAGQLSDERLREVAAHPQVKMFELKMSQGAKPGKGGVLPGNKVTAEIAAIRGIPVGESSLSPNRHPEIDSIDELLAMIQRIRAVTGKPTGVKLCIGAYAWLNTLCEEINRRGVESAPDFITVDGAEGGTGAAPLALMDSAGLPIHEALPLLIDTLLRHQLRERIKVMCSGKRITPTEVAWALCVGADFVNSARGFMFALGCIQALQCNKNTCPTGITTHDPKLQQGLVVADKAERVANYARNMLKEVGVLAHACGVREPRKLRRYHARVVCDHGLSKSLAELYPEPSPFDPTRML
jgi:glutamate synthase domain-containing protein 2